MQWGDNSCITADRLGEHPTPSDEVQLPGIPGADRQIGVSQQNLVCYDCSRLREDRRPGQFNRFRASPQASSD